MLSLTATLSFALSLVVLFQAPADRRFEVVSVKRNVSGEPNMRVRMPPGRFEAMNIQVRELIRLAHGLQGFQLVDGPEWLTTERYDIVATTDRAYAPAGEGAPPEVIAMVRTLLAERFGIRLQTESRDLPIFELRLARSDGRLGSGIRPVKVDCEAAVPATNGEPRIASACTIRVASTQLMGRGLTPVQLAAAMSRIAAVDRPVVDRTGLTGTYDLDLKWSPEPSPVTSPDAPGLFTAIQEQLGMTLQPQRGPVDVFVIVAATRPTED